MNAALAALLLFIAAVTYNDIGRWTGSGTSARAPSDAGGPRRRRGRGENPIRIQS